MSGYFITATGTGVGKTFTTCALLHAARATGISARGLKPVISGWDANDPTSDIMYILEAGSGGKPSPSLGGRLDGGRFLQTPTSEPVSPDPHPTLSLRRERASPAAHAADYSYCEDISLYRFTAPLSPHRAALLEGRQIDTSALVNWCRAHTAGEGLTLIEGAGGVMVPLTNSYTQLDLMAALKLPVILVVGSYLGTISHTLTALEVLSARGIKVAALVMNESAGSSVTLAEAEAGLSPFVQHLPLRIVQPRVSSYRDAHEIQFLMKRLV